MEVLKYYYLLPGSIEELYTYRLENKPVIPYPSLKFQEPKL
jgi:hypothetical protein